MPSDGYDYTRLLLRTDPTSPAHSIQPLTGGLTEHDLVAALTSAFDATIPVIAGIWAQVSPDPHALTQMLNVVQAFACHAHDRGVQTWSATSPEVLHEFIGHPDVLHNQTRRLRKNTLHGAYLALIDAGLWPGDDKLSPIQGSDPVPGEVRSDARGQRRHTRQPRQARTRTPYRDRVHVRPSTHDEILLIRLACRLAGTSRSQHLPAAAVALCCASATTGEAPQVRWCDLTLDATVALPGRPASPRRAETAIAARTVPLDPWAVAALEDWRQERGSDRPVRPEASVLYSGNQALMSGSAQAAADQAVRRVLEIADLVREPGLSAGSLRLWAAARSVTGFAALLQGATAAGVEPLTLHRQITQQGDRGLRRSF